MSGKLSERLTKERKRLRAKTRSNWPRKRFADGSLWILDPITYEPVEQEEPPDPSKGWKEG